MKKLGIIRKSVLHTDNRDHEIIREGRKALEKQNYSEADIAYYADRVIGVLDDYAARFGDGTPIEYIIGRRFGRIEVNIFISGEKYDPFEHGKDSKRRRMEKLFSLNITGQESCIGFSYLMGRNIITGYVPLDHSRKTILKNPTLWAVVLGIVVGLICLYLPGEAGSFIIDELLDPIYKIMLKLLAGIMGPVLFISLMTSIISLNSVNDLTQMGFRIMKRCLVCIMFFIAVSIGVSLIFFGNLGQGSADFSVSQIVTMLLNIIPINLVSPFLENNTPQLVVLAFVAGLAFLIQGERTKDLGNLIHQLNDLFMAVLRIVNRVMPAVPFLGIATAIGKGDAGVMLEGWKFILASYIIFTVCLIAKAVKTRLVTGISSLEVLRKSKSVIMCGFVTQSTVAPLSQVYEVSQKDLKIKPEFSSFWIPMSSAMMALKTAVNVITATVMMAEMMEVRISLSFLIVLIILTTEMSLASPGTVGSWVIAFEAFSFPNSYVGLFSIYRLLTANYATGAVIAYGMLEQVEAAYRMGGLDTGSEDASPAPEEG